MSVQARPMPELKLYIDGAWVRGGSGQKMDVVNPATGAVINQLPLASRDDLARAVTAAARAFETWRDTAPADRARLLIRVAGLIRDRSAELAALTTLEMGMRFQDATVLVQRAADILEWEANEGRRLYGRILPAQFGLVQSILREPIGPVASFSPWNASIFTPCRKIGGALASGCTLVLKAAEETPHAAVALVKLFDEAGIPPGVLNLVYGNPAEVSEQLITAPEIRLVTFTGSVTVGKHLAQMAASHMKPSVMELGGHAPVIICKDADLVTAADRLVGAKYFGAGQYCHCPSRVFADAAIADEFAAPLVDRIRALRVGDGLEAGVTMGPLVSERRLGAISQLVDQAVGVGARALAGGERLAGAGYFYAPTLLADAPPEAAILRDEPFGPVMTLNRFDTLADAIRLANDVAYGLAAYAFTKDAATAHVLSSRLHCGMVGINHFGVSTDGMPFGGVKDSGFGREGGIEGILNYTIAKTVSHLHG